MPSSQEVFGTPTSDSVFGQQQTSTPLSSSEPMSGSFMDYFWSKSTFGKFLSHVGQGAAQGWGSAYQTMAPAESEILQKAAGTAYKAFTEHTEATTKAYNEAFSRPAAWQTLISAGLKTAGLSPLAGVAGLMGGIGGAGIATAETLDDLARRLNKINPGLGTLPGEAGEYIGSYASGQNFGELGGTAETTPKPSGVKPIEVPIKGGGKVFVTAPETLTEGLPVSITDKAPQEPAEQTGVIPENLQPQPPEREAVPSEQELAHIQSLPYQEEKYFPDLNVARANAIIGEGEQGFFNTFPPDEKTLEARTQAALAAGTQPPELKPPVTDPLEIARMMDPELMQKHDAAIAKLEAARRDKEALLQKTQSFPDLDFVQDEIARLESKGAENLKPKEQTRLEDLYDFKKAYKQVWTAQKDIENLDVQLQEFGPDVAKLVNYARTLIPGIKEEFQSKWTQEAIKYTQEIARIEAEEKAKQVDYSEPLGPLGHDEEVEPFLKKVDRKLDKVPPLSGFNTVTGEPSSGIIPKAPTKLVQPKVEVPKGKIPKTEETGPGGSLKPIEGTGEKKIMGGALSIEARAIQDGLEKDLGPLQTYNKRVFADQAEPIAQLIAKDPEKALEVGMGQRAAPEGIIPELVANAIERKARAEGDWELVRKLANSKLVSDANTMAVRLAARGENSGSPSAAIRAIQEAKQAATKKRGQFEKAIQQVVDQMKQFEVTPDKKTWKDYLDELRCT